jgi:exosome complex component CSL4
MTAPTLRFGIGSTVAPGDRIGSIRQIDPGVGTYSRGGHVYASAVGRLTLSEASLSANEHEETETALLPICSVQLQGGRQYASSQVLTTGKIVLGKVLRIVLQQAVIEIVAAEGVGGLRNPHEGVIRREDVRTGATEEVQLYDSFRPGDIVLCRILSLGDSRRYYLSTAEAELGVVRAFSSTSGKRMVPISWKEMECPETKTKEPRKCANPKNLTATLFAPVTSQPS